MVGKTNPFGRLFERFKERMFTGVHPASLGIFRILIGLVFLVQFGRIDEYIINELPLSKFFLTYDGFHWLSPLESSGFEILFICLRIAAVLVVLGFLYRPAITFLFFGWTYIFMLCNGHYNNHYYMLSLVAFLLIFTQADNWGSLRQLTGSLSLRKKDGKFKFGWDKGVPAAQGIPFWQPFLLQFQISVVYFFGGIAKLQPDWLNGYPLKLWLPGKEFPFFAEFLNSEFAPYFFSYLGLIVDLLLPFILHSRKYRLYALFFLIPFHVSNHFLWQIGVFPWFMLFGTIIYFTWQMDESPLDAIKGKVYLPKGPPLGFPTNKMALTLVMLFMTWQLLFPFRSHLFEGKSLWTGVAWNFSWNMMLIDKSYATRIKVEVPEENISGYIDIFQYINPKQFKHIGHDPRHFIRFAHMIKDEMISEGLKHEPQIYVYAFREVNARPFQMVLDTTVNLGNYSYPTLTTPNVIMPYKDLPHEQGYRQLTPEERKMFGIIGAY